MYICSCWSSQHSQEVGTLTCYITYRWGHWDRNTLDNFLKITGLGYRKSMILGYLASEHRACHHFTMPPLSSRASCHLPDSESHCPSFSLFQCPFIPAMLEPLFHLCFLFSPTPESSFPSTFPWTFADPDFLIHWLLSISLFSFLSRMFLNDWSAHATYFFQLSNFLLNPK